LARLQPATLVLLADSLDGPGPGRDSEAAIAVLRRGLLTHPRDVWINKKLGDLLATRGPEGRAEAVAFYRVAYALQPATGHELAHQLADQGRGAEAEAVFRELADLRGEPVARARDLTCLGRHLKDRGGSPEAGIVLGRAVAALREAVRLRPDDAWAYYS